MSNITALNTYLAPFQRFFDMERVSEICINQPYGLWVEQGGVFSYYDVPRLSPDYLMQFAILVAEYNQREISPEHPTLSSVLPDGSRVQFVIEPACEKGSFVCSIRRKAVLNVPLDNYFQLPANYVNQREKDERQLLELYKKGDMMAFLKLAVLLKKNIIISGGTSTGKTSLLNSMLQFVPLHERLITVETDREVQSAHLNVVHLLAAEEGKSLAKINMLGLLKTALRLRPDRIFVSELRAEEAFAYLRAVNSGHPGSMTTLHADSPQGCFEQLGMMGMQSHSNFSRDEIIHYAKSVIPIVVQIQRDSATSKRFISEVYFDAAEKLKHSTPRKKYTLRNDYQGCTDPNTTPRTQSAVMRGKVY
jgi:type IV secretion system protein VirB11